MSTAARARRRRGRLSAAACAAAVLALVPVAAPAAADAAAPAAVSGPVDTGILQTPAQRARYQRLAEELRCLVCQNQTLADSNAELAGDLRRQVENMILAGRSDEEIKHYMVERYGDFVLYRPPVERKTWLLWLGPFALLAIGILVWLRVQRRSRATGSSAAPDAPDAPEAASAATLERARRLLDDR